MSRSSNNTGKGTGSGEFSSTQSGMEQELNRLRRINEITECLRMVINTKPEVLWISPALRKLFGYEESVIEINLSEIIHPEDLDSFKKQIRSVSSDSEGYLVHRLLTSRQEGECFMISGKVLNPGKGDKEILLNFFRSDLNPNCDGNFDLQGKRYRTIFETIPDPVVLSRFRDGKILEVNSVFLRETGYRLDQVLNKTSVELGFFGQPKRRTEFLKQMDNQDVMDLPQMIKRINGRDLVFSVYANKVSIEGEEYLVTIFRNVTKNQQQEKILAESLDDLQMSEAKFSAFVDLSPEGIVMVDNNGIVREWNRSMEKFTKLEKKEIVGKKAWVVQDLVQQASQQAMESREEIEMKLTRLLDPADLYPEPLSFSLNLEHPGEDKIRLENTIFTFNTDVGRQIGMICRDVTSQKKGEETTLLYKNIFDNNLDGIAVLDLKANYLEINNSHVSIMGFPKEELTGANPSVFIGEKRFGEIFKVFEFQGVFEGELEAKTKTGKDVYIDYILFPVISDGTTICNIEIIRDISERKNSESELIRSKRRAEEADFLKTAFLSNMSHEIRTPMNAILGFAALLEKPGLSYQQRLNYLSFINKNGETLLHLIGDIIDIAKIESNQLQITRENANLTESMQKIRISMQEVMEREQRSEVRLLMSVPADEEFILYTDMFRLEQVLNNLIYNAIKFTQKGFIEFGYIHSGPEELLFYVKDTGMGIPEERLENIFKRFHKLEHSRNKLYGGAGLGLAISSQIIKLLGGRIWVESYLDKGSIFYFTIPDIRTGTEEFRNERIITPVSESWKGKKILVEKDDTFSYELMKDFLNGFEIELITTTGEFDIVSMVAEHPDINLIIISKGHEGPQSIETAGLIREINPEVPLVAFTAFGTDDLSGQNPIFNEYLSKPLDRNRFLAIVSKYL